MEPRRRGRVPGGLLAFAGADVFREQRSLARVGWRDGAVQEELPGPGGDGTARFIGAGVPVRWAGCSAGAGPLASEARQRRYWRRVLAGMAAASGGVEDCS